MFAKGWASEKPTEVTVATGYPEGYTPPKPDVTNRSPTFISALRGTLFTVSSSCTPVPVVIALILVRLHKTGTEQFGSLIRRTLEKP